MRPVLSLVLLVSMYSIPACTSDRVTTSGERPADYALHDGYTWSSRLDGATGDLGRPLADEEAVMQVREALGTSLAASGMAPVDPRDATLSISSGLFTRTTLESLDPYYSNYVAAKYEEGILVLEFREASTGELVWRGESRARLRSLARGMGVTTIKWVDQQEPRSWPIETMIEEIVAASGLRESGLDEASRNKPLSRSARRSLYRRLDEAFPEPKVEIGTGD